MKTLKKQKKTVLATLTTILEGRDKFKLELAPSTKFYNSMLFLPWQQSISIDLHQRDHRHSTIQTQITPYYLYVGKSGELDTNNQHFYPGYLSSEV